MTLVVWPNDLPRPLRSSYGFGRIDARRMTPVDDGPPRPVRRLSRTADTAAMTLALKRWQLARFNRFFEEETRAGTVPFSMPDPSLDGFRLLGADGTPFLASDGMQIRVSATWLCHFGGQLPAVATRGAGWRVSFEVYVMP